MLDPETARTYLDEHKVEEAIAAAVAQVIRERPADPVALVGKILQTKSASALSTISWNIAAINNNPFEYWLTHPDPAYAKLMEDVENFVEAPGDTDVPVGEVFTPAMFDELDALMTAQGWDCAEQCRAAYASLAERTIIAGFMKDAELGNKRLMSMPDRMTNTIDLVGGGLAFRPTVISSFAGEMSTVATWWAAWKDFLFAKKLELPDKKSGGASSKLPAALLSKIPRSKYPALTEEDEAMSVRLQTVCLAIFDAILVHMLNQAHKRQHTTHCLHPAHHRPLARHIARARRAARAVLARRFRVARRVAAALAGRQVARDEAPDSRGAPDEEGGQVNSTARSRAQPVAARRSATRAEAPRALERHA
jgi:hypothetical protein